MGTAPVGTTAMGAAAVAGGGVVVAVRGVVVWAGRVPVAVPPEAPVGVGRCGASVGRCGASVAARGGIGRFGDTTMIARRHPSDHQGEP